MKEASLDNLTPVELPLENIEPLNASEVRPLQRGVATKQTVYAASALGSSLGIITASLEKNVPSIAAGASYDFNITATGAVRGDYVLISFSESLLGCMMTASVDSANTIMVELYNGYGSAADLNNGTFYVTVFPSDIATRLAALVTDKTLVFEQGVLTSLT